MTTPYYQRSGVTLYQGDFRKIMADLPPATAEAIITDPPYPRGFSALYPAVGDFANHTLRQGGSLLAILPTYNLPSVVAAISAVLKWRWLIMMDQSSGAHARMAMGIEVTHKPIGWWVKGAWPKGRGFIPDSFDVPGPAKSRHPWEQSRSWARAMLRFVPPGQLVIDPMAGSGTLLEVARELGYPAIGVEIDPVTCDAIIQRLEEV